MAYGGLGDIGIFCSFYFGQLFIYIQFGYDLRVTVHLVSVTQSQSTKDYGVKRENREAITHPFSSSV